MESHESLVADPINQLKSALQTIESPMSPDHEHHIRTYLSQLGSYSRPTPDPIPMGSPVPDEDQILDELRAFRPTAELPSERFTPEPYSQPSPRRLIGIVSAALGAIAFAGMWIGVIWIVKQIAPEYRPRFDQLVWVLGVVLGLIAHKATRVGTRTLGIICAVLTLVVFVAVSFPITVINWNFAADDSTQQFIYHNTKGAIHGLRAPSSIIFVILGILSAYKHASANGPTPPGFKT